MGKSSYKKQHDHEKTCMPGDSSPQEIPVLFVGGSNEDPDADGKAVQMLRLAGIKFTQVVVDGPTPILFSVEPYLTYRGVEGVERFIEFITEHQTKEVLMSYPRYILVSRDDKNLCDFF